MNRTGNLKAAIERLNEAQQMLLLAIEKETIPLIDRDLILEKLRRAYDSILFEDAAEKQTISASTSGQPACFKAEKTSEITLNRSIPEAKPQDKAEPIPSQKIAQPERAKTIKKTSIFDSPVKLKPVDTPDAEEENRAEANVEWNTQKPKEKSILDAQQAESLAEKFQGKRKFMTDSLSNQIKSKPVAAKLQDQPINDLTKEIGVHDRFLFIKELFNGDSKLYEDTVNRVNGFDDITEALIYIQENFNWNDKNKAANKFIELIRRKLLNS